MSNTTKDDGGPAFPQHDLSGYGMGPVSSADGLRYKVNGMSLRDWFAGQALCAMELKNDSQFSQNDHNSGLPLKFSAWAASAAYRIADAMLAARKEG